MPIHTAARRLSRLREQLACRAADAARGAFARRSAWSNRALGTAAAEALEALEHRRLMAGVGYDGGTVSIDANGSGTNVADVQDFGNHIKVVLNNGQSEGWYGKWGVDKIEYNGGSGNDTLKVARSVDIDVLAYGGAGDDRFDLGAGNDTVHGGSGYDRIDTGAGTDSVSGGEAVYGAEKTVADPDGGSAPTPAPTPSTGANSAPPGTPYANHNLSRIEAEHYDQGGQNVAFYDADPHHDHGGGNFRNTGVDLQGSDNLVGWTREGEWLRYTVNVPQAGEYRVSLRAATGTNGSTINVTAGDQATTGRIPNRGWAGYQTVDAGTINLNAGKQTIRVGFHNSNGDFVADFNWLGFQRVGSGSTNNSSSNNNSSGGNSTPAPSTPAPAPVQPSNGQSPEARISATSSRNIMAGTSFHAHALDSRLNGGSETGARYEWDFGDPSGRYNTMVGFNAAHLYDRPGTYTVKLKVYNDGGKSSTTTTTVNVAPDTRTKIYVSPWGNDSNDGLSEGRALRTAERAMQRLGQLGDNTAVLFQRGQTFDVKTRMLVRNSNVTLGAYGSGSAPTINWTNNRSDHHNNKSIVWFDGGRTGMTIRDLRFDTPHNDTSGDGIPSAIQPGGDQVTVVDNLFADVGEVVNGNAHPEGVLMMGNRVESTTDLRRYFAWIEGSDWTLLGNKVPNSTREHIVRLREASRVNIGDNEFANHDRRGAGDRYDTAKGTLTVQSGEYAYAWGNKLEGPASVGPLGDGDGYGSISSRFNHFVFEGNYNLGKFQFEHGTNDAFIRSNVFRQDDDATFIIEGYNASYGRTVENVHIANNTVINNGTTGKFARTWQGSRNINLAGNLMVAPNIFPGPYGTALVQVHDHDLRAFGTVENNVWADARFMEWAGGLFWVGMGEGNSGFQDKGEWLRLNKVSGDKFSNTRLDGNFKPTNGDALNAAKTYPGVFTDFHGKWRDGNGSRAAGAVEA